MRTRIYLFFIILLIIIPSLALMSSAHSGKTDQNGGHTDHDTGEYHYHHGYPAHDHYDIDGDGIVDCPYKFDDKTGHSSGSASQSSRPGTTTSSSNVKPSSNDSNASSDSSFWSIFAICYCSAAILFLPCAYLSDYLHAKRHDSLASLFDGIPVVLWLLSLPLSEILRRLIQRISKSRR